MSFLSSKNFILGMVLCSTFAFAQDRTIREIQDTSAPILIDDLTLSISSTNNIETIKGLDSLKENLLTCGFKLIGRTCLDTDAHAAIDRVEENKQTINLYKTYYISKELSVLLEIKVNRDSKIKLVNEFNIYQIKSNISIEIILKDLKKNKLKKIGVPKVSEADKEDLLQYVYYPNQSKRRFHLVEAALSTPTNIETKLEIFKYRPDFFITSANQVYQDAYLKLIDKQIKNDIVEKKELLNLFLDSSWRSVQQQGAVLLAKLGEKTPKIKELVKSATQDSNWIIRRDAVMALGGILDNVEDEIHLLKMITDSDSDVKKAVLSITNRLSFNDQHLLMLSTLADHANWSVRQQAVQYLSGIEASTNVLIRKILDTDSDVRKLATQKASARLLTAENLPMIKEVIKSHDWNVRMIGVELLAKINNLETQRLIIQQLISDSDSDVKRKAQAEIQKINLSMDHFDLLKSLASSSDWNKRILGLDYLSRVSSLEAELIVIEKMWDSDSDVKRKANLIIQKINLNSNHLGKLVIALNSADWNVRKISVGFVAKIRTIEAKELLIKRLAVESDSDVKNALIAAIAHFKI